MGVLVYVHKSFSLVGTRGHMNSHTRALNLSGEIKKLIVVSPEGFDVQLEPQMRKPIVHVDYFGRVTHVCIWFNGTTFWRWKGFGEV